MTTENFLTTVPYQCSQFFSKIPERVVYVRLMKYLTKHNILSNNQLGFRKNHSTFMAVLDLIDNLSKSIDEKEFSVGVFY